MKLDLLAQQVGAHVQSGIRRLPSLSRELAYEVQPAALLEVCRTLRDAPALKFEMLMDLAGVDYLDYGRDEWQTNTATRTGFSRGRVARERDAGPVQSALLTGSTEPAHVGPGRFAVAYQLLSITHNHRLRLRVMCESEEEPTVDSVVGIWASAQWFEREAFDLYGIVFKDNPDLRRILTDYGFIGHPFRKDFPLTGNVEVHYDPEKKRVAYRPTTIVPRVLVPKTIREDARYEPALKAPDPELPR